ncbi:CDP-glucose 4,6-dehydratase [Candidatus Nitrosarchaeum limnium]|jgi:CDP-glucose 4,6-dehydratase|uniref:CDP-glucose 4,6-dehydratase n=1 Tax=Candidatus Nitrosarchaeum limnium BG20 TaxID=859192 RepID=S2E327_9ARCH|nr:CDP-glucose 4,6-dehydratase [Candidatus Nitrosarchaeum limnium]EPA05223.1 CDP-glucose 4,6-dehydratase [Candidatus Nitrosarchaeum limnium BG20]
MNKEFWNKKKVLVTGHTGFKGSWLSLLLQRLNADVVGFSKSIPTNPSLFELAHIENGMTSIIGDICDYDKLEFTIKEHKPEIVIHMAAQAILRESYSNPIETYSTNVMGTVNLLESIRKTSDVKVILNVTTDKCYEPNESLKGHIETDRLGGYDPYSNSKACSELVTASFRDSFFNPKEHQKHGTSLASCRAGNVIGGGDWGKDRLIPDIIRGILNNEIIKIRNPNSTRPWQYVLDPLNGYLTLAEKLWSSGSEFSEGWNFGPQDDEKPVKWIVEKITEQWSKDIRWDVDNGTNPHEENHLRLNCSKANSRLEWMPKLNVEQGLEWTIQWYKQYEQNKDMKEITEQQIEEFQKL